MSFIGCDAARLMAAMPEIAVSSGAACSSTQTMAASVVLRRMGLSEARAIGSLRISLGRGTTEQQIDTANDTIERAVRTVDRGDEGCEL